MRSPSPSARWPMPSRDGATEAEALVMADDAALTRFANSQIHQNVAETNVTINLRFVVGKRVGVASSGRTDDEGLRRLAENAAAIAAGRRGARGLGRPARTDRDPTTSPAAYSRATAEATPEFRAEAVRAVIARRATTPASPPTARSRPAPRRSPSPTRRAPGRPGRGPSPSS